MQRSHAVVVLTQLIYLQPGKEAVFDAFEEAVIPLFAKHRGDLLLRLRPAAGGVVSSTVEVPYEVHLVRFQTDDDFTRFVEDPERQRFLSEAGEGAPAHRPVFAAGSTS
jgi:hypothetical protein